MDLPETFHIGFGDGDDLNLVLMLLPSAFHRLIAAAQEALKHPDLENISVILHGDEPLTLKITLPRTALLSMAEQLQSTDSMKRLH